MTNEERIKADAEADFKNAKVEWSEAYALGRHDGYIAGATAENDRAQHNEKVFEDTMQRILNVASWADDPYKNTLRRVVSTAKEQWKSGKGKHEHVELSCMVCGTKFMGPEPQMCCSGRDCGCMGMPVDPIVCSEDCYNKLTNPQQSK